MGDEPKTYLLKIICVSNCTNDSKILVTYGINTVLSFTRFHLGLADSPVIFILFSAQTKMKNSHFVIFHATTQTGLRLV